MKNISGGKKPHKRVIVGAVAGGAVAIAGVAFVASGLSSEVREGASVFVDSNTPAVEPLLPETTPLNNTLQSTLPQNYQVKVSVQRDGKTPSYSPLTVNVDTTGGTCSYSVEPKEGIHPDGLEVVYDNHSYVINGQESTMNALIVPELNTLTPGEFCTLPTQILNVTDFGEKTVAHELGSYPSGTVNIEKVKQQYSYYQYHAINVTAGEVSKEDMEDAQLADETFAKEINGATVTAHIADTAETIFPQLKSMKYVKDGTTVTLEYQY